MMRLWLRLVVLAALVCPLLYSVPSGAAEFSANVITKAGPNVMTGKFYMKGQNFRQEFNHHGQTQISIFREDKGVSWMLMPQEKMYMEMSTTIPGQSPPPTDPQELEQMAKKEFLGKETVNGYECEKYRYEFTDKSQGTMTQWLSKKLNFPVKIEIDGPGGRMTTEYKDIEEGNVSDSLFEVPSGYQKMSMPGMPPGMGSQ